jgi:UDPglucose 6-dehydrogenase
VKYIYLYSVFIFSSFLYGANIAVVGSGYVGLVLGAGLAEFGHNVCCLDIDQSKVDKLSQGIIPIFEPGLNDLVQRHLKDGAIAFSTDVAAGIKKSSTVFIAVGTPMKQDGHADLTAVEAVTKAFAKNLNYFKTLVIKSTVPIGTNNKLKHLVNQYKDPDIDFSIVSNPEFLREGFAVSDFLHPDRAIFGLHKEEDKALMADIFAPLVRNNIPLFFTDPTSAEMVKYASNAFLATKISYINEMSRLCDKAGANIHDVAFGMGMDTRIGREFLIAGPGFGGSCFPKDTNEIIKCAEGLGVDLSIVNAALGANAKQFDYIVSRVQAMIGEVKDAKIAILGLAFKANTDDVRDSPAINIISKLVKLGAKIRAYDPIAMSNMKNELPNIEYSSSEEDAINGADLVLILTEWPHFKNINWVGLKSKLGRQIRIFDARNILDKEKLQALGLEVNNLGNYKAVN